LGALEISYSERRRSRTESTDDFLRQMDLRLMKVSD
jgi:hypothetical protein